MNTMLHNNKKEFTKNLNISKVKPQRSQSVSPRPKRVNSTSLNTNNSSNNHLANGSSYKERNGKSCSIAVMNVKEPTTIISNDSRTKEILMPKTPTRLLLISSRCKYAAVLEKSVNQNVVAILYNYETVTFDSLLSLIYASLDTGQRISSVACMLTCKSSGMLLVHSNVKKTNFDLNQDISSSQWPGKFFCILFDKFVDLKLKNCRLDFMATGLQLQNSFVPQLSKLLGIPVSLSKEFLGSDTFVELNGNRVSISEIYFKSDKLRSWSNGSYQTIDLFEKIRMVGKGAFGTAVLYKKKDDNSLVVLKEINMTELNGQERLMAMNETRVLAMLNHPNIICYYDTFEENGVLMIEMEYADDGTLAQFLTKRESPLEEKTILSMFVQIVAGISYMHEQKVLHRDLKTANIFLTKEGTLKIGDFGVSKVMSTNKAADTVLGTPYYISPEICEGKSYNDKSDIWALGCILYEMATRQRTFEGTNLPALVHKIMNGQISPIRGDYTSDFRKLVKDMLNKNPEQRPTARQLELTRLPELLVRFGIEERPFITPGSRGSSERKRAEGTRSVLYLYDTMQMNFTPIEGFPSKIKIRQVSVGLNHVLVVAMERVVYSWGENTYGQLGQGHVETVTKPQLVDALKGKSIVSASCGHNFSVFLSDNGITMTCGDGRDGCLGHNDTNSAIRPRLVEPLLAIDVATVACGHRHVVVLGTDGEIYSWGCGENGRLGTNSEENSLEPKQVFINQSIRDVKCGVDSTIFVTEIGTLLACGNNKHNKLGLNERSGFLMAFSNRLKKTEVENRKIPMAIKSIKGVVDVSMGTDHTVVLSEPDHVYVLGSNNEGQMGAGDNKVHISPSLVKTIKQPEILAVACGPYYTVVGTSNGVVMYWGTRSGPRKGKSYLHPPKKGHQRSTSSASTLSVRSRSSNYQHDSASEGVSRSSSVQDLDDSETINLDNNFLSQSQSISLNQSQPRPLLETIFAPLPILNIHNSGENVEDLSAFLDNLIPFRENIFILVETNAPLSSEPKKNARKRSSEIHNLQVPSIHPSVSSVDDSSSDISENSDLTPLWIQKELQEACVDKKDEPGKTGIIKTKNKFQTNKTSNSKSTKLLKVSPKLGMSKNTRIQRRIPSAKSDSSSDSSSLRSSQNKRHLSAEPSKSARSSISSAKDVTSQRSPRSSPYISDKVKTPRSRSPFRSPIQLARELERLSDEKKTQDQKLEELRRDHQEVLEKMRDEHNKEKEEQEERMRSEIEKLREQLESVVKQQIEINKRGTEKSVNSKICSIQ